MKVTTTKSLYNKDQSNISHAKWLAEELTRQQFIAHVTSGNAWAIGAYTDNLRRADHFISSSVIALDIDGVEGTVTTLDNLTQNAFLATYTGFIYASPSWTPEHQKWRVVFFLDEPIVSADEYKTLTTNLIAMMSKSIVGIDCVAKDSARFFFGHDLKSRPSLVWQSDNTLPLSVVRDIEGAEAVTRMSYKPSLGRRAVAIKDSPVAPTKAMRVKAKQFIARIDALETTKLNRNNVCFKLCADMNDAGIKQITAYALIYSAMVKNGYITDANWKNSFDKTFSSAFGKIPNNNDVSWMNNSDTETPFLLNAHDDRLLKINTRYITDMESVDFERMMSYPVVLIKSPTGSGKSTMIKQIVRKFIKMNGGKIPRVLVICHRKALVNRTATDLEFPTHATDDFKGSAVTTIDSLYKYQASGGVIDHDIIFLDEATQSLIHMVNSPFLKKKRIAPQAILTGFLKHAKLVVCMDANFSHESALWLERTSERKVLRVFNEGQPPKRNTTVWSSKHNMLQHMVASAKEGFTAIACCNKGDAHTIERIANKLNIKNLCVTSETSDNQTLESALLEINTSATQLLIYTSSLGTGVDITRACKNAYLVATSTLTGEDCVQMISRVRNAEKYHVVGIVQSKFDYSVVVTKEQILEDFEWRAFYDTIPVQNGNQQSAELYAELKVAENFQRANQSKSFCRSALQNGFRFEERIEGDCDEMRDLFRACGKIDVAWQCETTMTHAPVTAEEQRVIIENKTNTREITYGRKRNVIENLVGETILMQYYEELHTKTKYERMLNLVYIQLESSEKAELERSKNEDASRQDYNPILKRTQFYTALMEAMGQSLESLPNIVEYTKDMLITPAVKSFIDNNRDPIRWLFGRSRFTEDHVTELQFLLLQFNIPLTRKSKNAKGTRVRSGNGERTSGTRESIMRIDGVELAQRLLVAEKIIETIRTNNVIREARLIREGN